MAQARAEREADLLEALRRIRVYTDHSAGAGPHDVLAFAMNGLRSAIDKTADAITGIEGYFLHRHHSVMGSGTPGPVSDQKSTG